jgi:N-acetylglutamate synthase-like GNAT family acetyltransferase
MELAGKLEFDNRDRKDIYDYVERHGAVTEREVRRSVGLDETAFGHHLTVLRRDGYLQERDGKLEVAYKEESAEEHRVDGIEYTIRLAHQRDLSGLVGVIRQVAEEGTYIEAENVADLIDYEEVVLRHNELQSRVFFVATVEEEVIGWVHLALPEAEKLSHTAVLTVGVLPEYRSAGIGGDLLRRGLAWARENGYEKVYNSIPAVNENACDFLEHHGWEVEAVRADHYKIDGDYVDEVMMAVDI